MKYCQKCVREFELENKCTNCGGDLEMGRLPGTKGLEREKIEMSGEQCGFCGRVFQFHESFCGNCGKPRDEAVQIKFRSYTPETSASC